MSGEQFWHKANERINLKFVALENISHTLQLSS